MNRSSKIIMFVMLFAFIVFVISSPFVFAETIILKSGKTVEGAILERGSDYIKVDFQGIPIKYYLDDILTIEGEGGPAAGPEPAVLTPEAENLFDEGLQFLAQERYWEAISAFKKVVALSPEVVEAYYNIGGSYFLLGQYEDAVYWYKKTVEVEPNHISAYLALGMNYRLLVKYPEAINYLEQAAALDPQNPLVFMEMALCYQLMEEYPVAARYYEEVIALDPNNAEAQHSLGMVYGDLGRWQEAIEAFSSAIDIDPDYADAYVSLALTLAFLEKSQSQGLGQEPEYAEAWDYFEQAKELYQLQGLSEQVERVAAFMEALSQGEAGNPSQ